MKKYKQKEVKNSFSKLDIAILIDLIFSVAFFFIYHFLLKVYFFERYESAFFINKNMMFYFPIPFLLVNLMGIIICFSESRKMQSKKYIIICSLISTIILIVSLTSNCNVWVANEKGISYNTIFSKEKISYSYDDITTVTVQYSANGIRPLRGKTLVYNVIMQDGKELELQLFDLLYQDSNSLINFDKKISDKRKIVGDFVELAIPDELNNYYHNIFCTQSTGDGSSVFDNLIL